jgi:predicted metal-binding membrane protein
MARSTVSPLEAVLKRDRLIVVGGLAVVVLMAAWYTVAGIGMTMSAVTMTRMAIDMPGMMMAKTEWSLSYAVLVFLMWWVMMVAMMVPSAAPAILIYAGAARKRKDADHPLAATFSFLAGYLVTWALFSVLATCLQWGLERIDVVTGMMEIASPRMAGLVLIAAGLYQLTPLKTACLKHCQHPVFFLMHHWKSGTSGAFRMGLEHGGYCLGCCWFLMALLFVGGIMNLLWIAGLAILVGIEKLAGGRPWVTTLTGVALAIAGLWMVAGSFLAGGAMG